MQRNRQWRTSGLNYTKNQIFAASFLCLVSSIDPLAKAYGKDTIFIHNSPRARSEYPVQLAQKAPINQDPVGKAPAELMDQASVSFAKGDFPEAIALWTQIIINTSSVSILNEALINRSKAYLVIGQPSLALSDLSACQYKPSQVSELADLWLLKGSAHLQNKQYSEAISAFAQSERLRPGNSILYSNRSVAYQALGKLVEAKSDITAAIKLEPNFSNYFNLAILQKLSGNPQACFDLLSQMIKQSQPYGQLFTQRGLCAAMLGRHDEAISDMLKALKLDQGNVVAMEQLGLSLVAKNQKESGRQYLVKASSMRLTSGEVKEYQRILSIISSLDRR
jgi:Flp pilus assembly protein TadD